MINREITKAENRVSGAVCRERTGKCVKEVRDGRWGRVVVATGRRAEKD